MYYHMITATSLPRHITTFSWPQDSLNVSPYVHDDEPSLDVLQYDHSHSGLLNVTPYHYDNQAHIGLLPYDYSHEGPLNVSQYDDSHDGFLDVLPYFHGQEVA